MTHYIAVDIGGTQLRAACYATNSLTPLKIDRTPTQAPGSPPLERLMALIESIWPVGQPVASIGVAAAGPLDPYTGVIMEAPNIAGWIDLPLRQNLEDRFHVPVALGNDANLAALGEWKIGAGRGHSHLIYITVSTGIGGGVIVNNQLLLGQHGLAGEVGHITVMPDGPMCGCGQRGHLEAVAAGPALANWAAQEISRGAPSSLPAGKTLTAKMVGLAAQQGDALATAAVARSGTYIGKALADFVHIFNPSAIIIGGGVSQSGSLLLVPMRQALEESVLSPHYLRDLTLTTAALGDEAGLMGALTLAQSLEIV